MPNKRWSYNNKTVFNIGYHIIWCTKYRRQVLSTSIQSRLSELLYKKASEIGINIKYLSIMPDHVHLFVKTSPTDSPHWVVQQLKGYTSRILRNEFKELKTKIPTLWTRSYYTESVGHISENTIKKYIEEQKTV